MLLPYLLTPCPVLTERILIRALPCATSGTDRAYAAIRCPYGPSRRCYAELAYAATRRLVLTFRMVQRAQSDAPVLTGLCCYAGATQCPVLHSHRALRSCYALCGTALAYAATIPSASEASLAHSEGALAEVAPYALLRHVRYPHSVWGYYQPTRVLRDVRCMVRWGYGAMRCSVWGRVVLCDVRYCHSRCCYQPTRLLRTVRTFHDCPQVTRLSAYAVSGTDLAYGDISLRACYPMFGTDIAYAAIRPRCLLCGARVWCYGMWGTELGYGATSPSAGGHRTRAMRCTKLGYGTTGVRELALTEAFGEVLAKVCSYGIGYATRYILLGYDARVSAYAPRFVCMLLLYAATVCCYIDRGLWRSTRHGLLLCTAAILSCCGVYDATVCCYNAFLYCNSKLIPYASTGGCNTGCSRQVQPAPTDVRRTRYSFHPMVLRTPYEISTVTYPPPDEPRLSPSTALRYGATGQVSCVVLSWGTGTDAVYGARRGMVLTVGIVLGEARASELCVAMGPACTRTLRARHAQCMLLALYNTTTVAAYYGTVCCCLYGTGVREDTARMLLVYAANALQYYYSSGIPQHHRTGRNTHQVVYRAKSSVVKLRVLRAGTPRVRTALAPYGTVCYLPTRVLCHARYWHSVWCYAMSGTEIAWCCEQ
eukprot:2075664-Rhodomonas_salina.2